MTFWSLSEGGLEVEEVNAVDAVQEIVDITVDAELPRASGRSERNRDEHKGGDDGEVGRQQPVVRYVRKEMRDWSSFETVKEVQHEVLGR